MKTLRHGRGFTLIEMLVAIAIMALLGLMSWRALDNLLQSRAHLKSVETRWQVYSRGFALIEINLLQSAQRKDPKAESFPDFQLEKLEDGRQRLAFWRNEVNQGARLVGFTQEQDRLQLLRWPRKVVELNADSEPILRGVQNIKWAVLDRNLNWQEVWPPKDQADAGLPLGVRLDMDITELGHVQRIFALR